jgi:hypothetical protein
MPPGGGVPIDLPAGRRIQDVVMPAPYKEVGPAFPAFIQHVEDRTKQLAMVANSPVGEGKQDAPVGTTLALIEQATKVEASAFKRLHDAQAEEFQLLKELFQEDPEAMWRHNKSSRPPTWQKQQFLQALDAYELQPVADPNNPTSLHRAMKAALLKTLAMQNPMAYDMVAVDKRIMAMANIDASGIFRPPQPQQPDPMMLAMQARQQMMQLQTQLRQQQQQLTASVAIMKQQGTAADRASKERIEQMKADIEKTKIEQNMVLERLKLTQDAIIHVHGLMQAEHGQQRDDRRQAYGDAREDAFRLRDEGRQDREHAHGEAREEAQQAHSEQREDTQRVADQAREDRHRSEDREHETQQAKAQAKAKPKEPKR